MFTHSLFFLPISKEDCWRARETAKIPRFNWNSKAELMNTIEGYGFFIRTINGILHRCGIHTSHKIKMWFVWFSHSTLHDSSYSDVICYSNVAKCSLLKNSCLNKSWLSIMCEARCILGASLSNQHGQLIPGAFLQPSLCILNYVLTFTLAGTDSCFLKVTSIFILHAIALPNVS